MIIWLRLSLYILLVCFLQWPASTSVIFFPPTSLLLFLTPSEATSTVYHGLPVSNIAQGRLQNDRPQRWGFGLRIFKQGSHALICCVYWPSFLSFLLFEEGLSDFTEFQTHTGVYHSCIYRILFEEAESSYRPKILIFVPWIPLHLVKPLGPFSEGF